MVRCLILMVLVLAGCRESPREALDLPSPTLSKDPSIGGRFIANYDVASPGYRELRERLIASRLLDTVLAGLNDTLRVPENVIVAATECGEPSAHYRPEARRVSVCYELLDELTRRFGRMEGSDILIAGTFAFVMLHELGHAVVHVLDLPVTGREEDVADQFATLLMLREGAVGDSLSFAVASMFAQQADSVKFDELTFADEHGLDLQRVYNILCWIYGRDPTRYPEVVTEGWLTDSRASRCQPEYTRLAGSWRRLLQPHLRVPAADFP